MRFENALVVATTLVASTSAFMITPEIAKAAEEAQSEWNRLIFGAEEKTFDVRCFDCPFIIEEKTGLGGLKATVGLADVENVIRLQFTDNNGELQVNNATIYPFEAIDPQHLTIKVHQIRPDTGEHGIDQYVDFGVGVKEIKTPPRFRSKFGRARPENNVQIVPVEFTIFGLGGTPVTVESALIDLIYEADGKYTIAHAGPVAQDPPTETDVCDTAANPTLCRVRAMTADRLRSMFEDAKNRASIFRDWMKTHPSVPASHVGNKGPKKPCGGRPGREWKTDGDFHPFDFASREHGEGHKAPHAHEHFEHHKHHRGHKGHKFAHVIHLVIHTFMIPAILGVAGGLAASAIGMAVGQSIACLWIKYGRGGQRGPVQNVRLDEASLSQDEKEALMECEALPRYEENQVPEYEDAPRYEDEGRQA